MSDIDGDEISNNIADKQRQEELDGLLDYIEEVVNKEINQDNEANDVPDRNTYGIASLSRFGKNPYGITGSSCSKEKLIVIALVMMRYRKMYRKTHQNQKILEKNELVVAKTYQKIHQKQKMVEKDESAIVIERKKGKARALLETSSSLDSDDSKDSNFKNLSFEN
ncbi:hypothetical protein RCL_jg12303.t1 [Rhizophagus clarus]|uniref:Uncharacterized protein n=1 Tax=Rhizophagus clarus TaxID=94130 RepID=A0A8H3L0W7_9GLOM|nr:hypothetical protein RCL_jg12303.t1 [Rhizophagus clarus]